MQPGIKPIRSYRDDFEEEVIAEMQQQFRGYRHFDIGFGAMLDSLIFGISEPILRNTEFRAEIKYELKLIMSYMHMVREVNLIRDLKTSLFPMLLMGAAGNRTVVKQIILATHLSIKAMHFITETYSEILKRDDNQNPELVADLYSQMLADLRLINNRYNRIEQIADTQLRNKRLEQLKLLKLRRKNIIRRALGLGTHHRLPDDPFRSLPVMVHNEVDGTVVQTGLAITD